MEVRQPDRANPLICFRVILRQRPTRGFGGKEMHGVPGRVGMQVTEDLRELARGLRSRLDDQAQLGDRRRRPRPLPLGSRSRRAQAQQGVELGQERAVEEDPPQYMAVLPDHGADRLVRQGESVTLPLVCTYGTERLWYETPQRKRASKKEPVKQYPSRFDGYRNCTAFEIQETDLLKWIRAEVSASQQRRSETTALTVIKAAIVEDPLCVQALEALFTEVWRGSVAAPDRTGLGATASPDLRARVLRQLNSGVTDDVAARELSVSVRTYRRHVAEILTTLRADSRFQAGVRAARLGLVAPEPHAPAGGPRLLRRRGVGQAVTES